MQRLTVNFPKLRTLFSKRIVFVLVAFMPVCAFAEPMNMYLTFGEDTARQLVLHYQLKGDADESGEPVVYLDTQSREGKLDGYAKSAQGVKLDTIDIPTDRTLIEVALNDLEPNETYYFVAGDAERGYSEERSFRTLPADDTPIRFVTGGDMGVSPSAARLLEQGGKLDPMFCAIGGDLAYANGELWEYRTWDRWFENYDEYMRAPDGRMIPIFAAIGNHETNDFETTNPAIVAPFYDMYFGRAQSDSKTYFSRMFGSETLMIALDSGHVVPHGGEQTAWLAETLAANCGVPYIFCMYHVPLYPSHRDFDGAGSVMGRVHWEPYFLTYDITAGFENHDHKLKRSKPMKMGEPAEDGVLYIGDGCFGVSPRDSETTGQRPYLAVDAPKAHIWLVEAGKENVRYRAFGEDGELLDDHLQEDARRR